MDHDHKIRTPQKKYVVVFVCFLTGLSVISFLIFGHLLKEYFTYSVNKQAAENEIVLTKKNHDELKQFLRSQEDDFSSRISDMKKTIEQKQNDIAERESKIKSQQDSINEINVLQNQIVSAQERHEQLKNDLGALQKELGALQKELVISKSSYELYTKRNEDVQIKLDQNLKEQEKQKSIYVNDMTLLEQLKVSKEKDIQKLSDQKTGLDAQIETMVEKTLTLKQGLQQTQSSMNDERLKLSNLTTQLASLETRIQQENKKLSELITEQDNLQVALNQNKTEKAILSGETDILQKKKDKLQSEENELVNTLEKYSQQKASLEGEINVLQEKVNAAKVELNKIVSQIKKAEENKKDELITPAVTEEDNNAK